MFDELAAYIHKWTFWVLFEQIYYIFPEIKSICTIGLEQLDDFIILN